MDYEDAVATFTGVADANPDSLLQDTMYKEINQNMLKNNDIMPSKATSSKISGAVSKCHLNRKYSDVDPSAPREIPNK